MRSSPSQAAQSIWLIICLAVTSAVMRLSMVLANTLMLWHVYGRDRVAREQLQITRDRPDLVISNGDVLRGLGFQHYLIAAGSWVVLSFLVLLIVGRVVLPRGVQHMLKNSRVNTPDTIGVVCALGLFVLIVPMQLPLAAAVILAVVALVLALSWAWRIRAET